MNTPCSHSRRSFLHRLWLSSAAVALAARAGAQTPPQSQSAPGAATAPGRKLGIAVCGLGGYSHGQLAPALKRTQHCELRGVITGSPDKGRNWAREFGFPEKAIYNYGTMSRLIDNRDIDIVYVVTPNALHAEHTIAAAWAGKHVISEKPMANTVSDCNAMIAACRAAGVKLSLGYRLQFEPHYEELKRLAREKEFGAFMKMSGGLGFTMRQPQWRAQKALAGGGPLMDLGIYAVQAACMAANIGHAGNTLLAITAREHPKKRPDFFKDVEETIEWTMEFPGGAKGEFLTSYETGIDRFRAEAEKGWFEIAPAFPYGGLKATTSRGPLAVNAPPSQQAVQIDDFALCIKEDRATRVPGEMGRRDMIIIEAIYASAAQQGKRMEIKV